MRTLYQAELQQVNQELLQIAQLVQQALKKSAQALLQAQIDQAEEVISQDAQIDLLQDELDERAIDLLALQGPVASDLRTVVGSLRMSTSLERMGDLARHLAQLARMRYPQQVVPAPVQAPIEEMICINTEIMTQLISLLSSRDLKQAQAIMDLNSQLNDLHRQIFQLMTSSSWQEESQTTVDITLTSRYLERFGDHAVSVARKVTYLVTGDWKAERTS